MEVYATQQPNIIIDEDGIMRTARDGDMEVVVLQVLKQGTLNHLHGTWFNGALQKAQNSCADDREVSVSELAKQCL